MSFVTDKLSWIQAAIIFFLAVAQYSNTAEHDYAWDDAIVITQNTRVQKGLSDIPELFENIKSDRTENRYGYRPIVLLSFATDVELFGLNPAASHKVNILLYGFLCVLVFYFITNFFGHAFPSWCILAIVALFTTHPLHTEVVANIKSRDEILALIFGLSALLVFRKALVSRKLWFYPITVLFLVLAFTSKESALTLSAMFLVVPIYTEKNIYSENWRTLFLGVGLSVILGGLLLAIRQYVYSDLFFQTNDFELIDKGMFLQDGYVGNPLWDANVGTKVATAFFIVAYSIYRFFAPQPLLHDYSLNMFPVRNWGDWEVYLSVCVFLTLLALTIHGLVKRKIYGFGLALFFTSLSIYLHLVHVGPDIFAERYLFVPSLGLCIAMLSVFEIFKQQKVVAISMILICIPLFGYSFHRNKAWKDNQTLLETDLPRLKNCARANYNYALYLHDKYYILPQTEKNAVQQEILSYYENTLRITDRVFKVYMDLGSAYMEFGYPQKGYDVFVEASLKYPILSGPYVQLGKFFMSYSKYQEAVPYLDNAIRYGRTNSDYYYLKGLCQFQYGDFEGALSTLEEGKVHGITQAEYYVLMSTVLIRLEDKEQAEAILNEGILAFPQAKRLKELSTVF